MVVILVWQMKKPRLARDEFLPLHAVLVIAW